MSLPIITIAGNINFMELKYTPQNKAVLSFVVSCSEKRRDGTYDNLDMSCSCWDKGAEHVNQYFNDGDAIIVTGKMVTEKWVDANGNKKSKIKMPFASVSFVPRQKQVNNNATQNNQGYQQQPQQQQQAYNPPPQQQQQGYYTPPQQAPIQNYQQQQQQQQVPTYHVDAKGKPIPPNQVNQYQQQQQVPEIDVNSEQIPF